MRPRLIGRGNQTKKLPTLHDPFMIHFSFKKCFQSSLNLLLRSHPCCRVSIHFNNLRSDAVLSQQTRYVFTTTWKA
jgi:hypothetical protein